MSYFFSVAIGLSLILVVCGCGIAFGRLAEKLGAACILLANLAAELVIEIGGAHYPTAQVFAIDFLLAAALLIVAVRYSSLWLGCAMILQSIALYAHFMMIMGDQITSKNYILLNNGLTFLMLACILAGIISARWRGRAKAAEKPSNRDRGRAHLGDYPLL